MVDLTVVLRQNLPKVAVERLDDAVGRLERLFAFSLALFFLLLFFDLPFGLFDLLVGAVERLLARLKALPRFARGFPDLLRLVVGFGFLFDFFSFL